MKYHKIIFPLLTITALMFSGCAVSNAAEDHPNQWLSTTLNSVESVPVPQRYQNVIEQVAKAGNAIPASLRQAAGHSLDQKGTEAKRTLLMAAAPYFSNSCIPEDPTQPANKLLHICFEKKWPDGDFCSMLKHVDAATYLYARALKQAFEAAGVYKNQGRRLLDNFLMSNAHLREEN